jgi:hypothetical protein
MWLARVDPDQPAHDRRNFECTMCSERLVEVVRYR